MRKNNLLLLFFFFCIAGSNATIKQETVALKNTITTKTKKSDSESFQEIEDIVNQKNLESMYQTKLGSIKRRFMKEKPVSKAIGTFFADLPISKPYIKNFLKIYPDIAEHADEFVTPKGGITQYSTFNKFFYRKLSKKGYELRPIDKQADSVVSPADCHLFVVSDLSKNPDFFVKGCKFNLETFLKSEDLAKTYSKGTLLLFRLAPNDYHRFHFPFDCKPSVPKVINGDLESVNPIAYTPTVTPQYKNGKEIYTPKVQPLTENERHLITLQSQQFGEVICVIVGAMAVGKIYETYVPRMAKQKAFTKGDEMGYFAFGASTIVLIFAPEKIAVEKEFLQKSAPDNIPTYGDVFKKYTDGKSVDYPESKISMGQRVATRSK
jgi:phosphatidylserine decarboxylase